MKLHKSELYAKIPRKSDDFLRLFFAYKPGTLNKTQKQKMKSVLRKTAKIMPDDDIDLVTGPTQ
jgi:hypothetical protein